MAKKKSRLSQAGDRQKRVKLRPQETARKFKQRAVKKGKFNNLLNLNQLRDTKNDLL